MPSGNGSKWITQKRRLAVHLRDRCRCLFCNRRVYVRQVSTTADLKDVPARYATLDHLNPRANGGSHRARNLVTACRSCNSARGCRRWLQFADKPARDRINLHRRRKMRRFTKQASKLM